MEVREPTLITQTQLLLAACEIQRVYQELRLHPFPGKWMWYPLPLFSPQKNTLDWHPATDAPSLKPISTHRVAPGTTPYQNSWFTKSLQLPPALSVFVLIVTVPATSASPAGTFEFMTMP